ncbi:MAG: PD40 domain-containing protein [Acidobacteria bacterium]|nr:PD40 domain-containing protein [Acidobacteriota bacterium]
MSQPPNKEEYEAREAYEQVLIDYAEQADMVAEARARLVALEPLTRAGSALGIVVRQVWARADDILGAPSPDGRYLSFSKQEPPSMSIRDLATGETFDLDTTSWEPTDRFAGESVWSPDGRSLAYAWWRNGRYELRVANLDDLEPRVVYRSEDVVYPRPDAWTPDGDRILTLVERADGSHQIAFIDLADGSLRALKSMDWRRPMNMSLSPDGRWIVYDFPPRPGAPERDLFVLAADGSSDTVVVSHPADDYGPLWTPDGDEIVFGSNRSGTVDVWKVGVVEGHHDTDPMLVKKSVYGLHPMGFSRDGSYFYSQEFLGSDVYVTELGADGKLAGPPQKLMLRYEGGDGPAIWSPDGERLAYLSGASGAPGLPGRRALVIRSLQSGDEHELLPQLRRFEPADWDPDGDSILVRGQDTRGRWGFYEIDVRSGAVTIIVQEAPGSRGAFRMPTLSRDGRMLYYVSSWGLWRDDETIVARDRARKIEDHLYTGHVHQIAVSPDSRRLVFTYDEGIALLPASGGVPHEIFRIVPEGVSATPEWKQEHPEAKTIGGEALFWTPDGRYVVFVMASPESQTDELWRVPVGGGPPELLGTSERPLRGVTLHPDGSRILSYRGDGNRADVWVMENFLGRPSRRD